jgi:MFS family permease
MSAGTFGFAVGMFYWGYFIFEVPSNVILEKVGARVWIARIMITWGMLAGLTAMVTGSTSFAIVRFLLGVAEAGFSDINGASRSRRLVWAQGLASHVHCRGNPHPGHRSDHIFLAYGSA